MPSLVVCPPTLVGHWAHEISRFLEADVLRTLQYEGPPAHRKTLRRQAEATADAVIIMSYDTLRSDIDWLACLQWNYCILDEGHIVRNPKSKIAQVSTRALPASVCPSAAQALTSPAEPSFHALQYLSALLL